MRAGGISLGKCAVLALLILVVSLSAIAILDLADDASADDEENYWIKDNIRYTQIDQTRYLRVDGPIDTKKTAITEVTISSSMTLDFDTYTPIEIAPSAFSGCINLKTVSLPDSVYSIGSRAFYGCTSLGSVALPEGYVRYGDYAFANSGIESAEFKGPMLSMAPHIFEGCKNLRSVKFGDDVTIIGAYAFSGCSSLTGIELKNIETLGDKAFADCTSLENIVLSDVTESIGNYAFINCTKITDVTIPSGITVIPTAVFKGCTSLSSVTLHDAVRTINADAFNGCSSLNITLGDTVSYIGARSFQGCSSLIDLRITSSVKYIGENAFGYCTGLRYITIPKTITVLKDDVFEGTVFYDVGGNVISDQSKLPGYSYAGVSDKMTRCNGCYYVAKFDVNGGSVPIEDRNENIGNATVIEEYQGEKEGMVFAGWECEGVTYKVGDTFIMPGHSTQLNAVWEKYVPPPDNRLIDDEGLKFIAWAAISILFGLIILSASLYIIYRRRT